MENQLPFYLELFYILGPAAIVGTILTKLKQPTLIGYLLVGIVLGALGFHSGGEITHFLGELGIIALLFTAGLEMNPTELLSAWKPVSILTLFQLTLIGGLAFWVGSSLLHLSVIGSILLGVSTWLSSTIVVLGLLEKLHEKEEPHGKSIMASMVLQDIVALIFLSLLPTFAQGGDNLALLTGIGLTLLKAGGFVVFTILTGKFIFPRIFPIVENEPEQLLIWPLAWAFAHMAIAHFIGFSPESAAFFAGTSIATLGYSYIITDKVQSLTHFGLVFFFAQVGQKIKLSPELFSLPFFLIILLVIIGTPLSTLPAAAIAGFSKRSAFITGLIPAQISEFAIVLLALAAQHQLINDQTLTVVTTAAVISMIISSLLASNSNKIYQLLSSTPLLSWIPDALKQVSLKEKQWHVVIYGADPDFFPIAQYLQKQKLEVLIIDTDRQRLQLAKKHHLNTLKADYLDPETISHIMPTKILISTTIRGLTADLWTIKYAKTHNPKLFTITINSDGEQAKTLQQAKWDLVINPDKEATNSILAKLKKQLKA